MGGGQVRGGGGIGLLEGVEPVKAVCARGGGGEKKGGA